MILTGSSLIMKNSCNSMRGRAYLAMFSLMRKLLTAVLDQMNRVNAVIDALELQRNTHTPGRAGAPVTENFNSRHSHHPVDVP